jgi:hypothetical protein
MTTPPDTTLTPQELQELQKLLYTLDQHLPPRLTQYDLSLVCSYIIYRYGLPYTEARAVCALCLDFMLSSPSGRLDLSPPSSDREIN